MYKIINLRRNNINLLKNFLIIILLIFYTQILNSSENRIIFKINNTAFTSIDYEKRKEYLEFVGSNSDLSRDFIIKDFISANLFFEHYKKLNLNYEFEVNKVFENIKTANDNNNKKFNYEIIKKNILFNIKIDLTRKAILENILNSNVSNLDTSIEEIDLLYKFKIYYINFKLKNPSILLKEINNITNIDLKKTKFFLDNRKITYFEKSQEINNIEKIDERIKNKILERSNFFIFEKNNKVTIAFIEKTFETYNGLIANIYSVNSKDIIEDKDLKCNMLKKLNNNSNVINKEYNFLELNNEIKNNLININDYIKFKNNDKNIYVVLCDIKFDKKILDNINLNKLININVDEIEKEFVKKYSKTYNLKIIND